MKHVIQVSVLGFDDLVKNKKAVGRNIDLEDIAALKQMRPELLGKQV